MKKSKGKKKTDDIRVFEANYLAAINSNLELTKENQVLTDELERLKSQNTIVTTGPGKRKYLIRMNLHTNTNELVYDFTDIIQLIQFESPELPVKILRQVHHYHSILNINEMTTAIKWYEPQSKLWTLKTVQAPRN